MKQITNQSRVTPYLLVVQRAAPPTPPVTQQIEEDDDENDSSRKKIVSGHLKPKCLCLKAFLIGCTLVTIIALAVTVPIIVVSQSNNKKISTTTTTTTTTTTSTSTSTTTTTTTTTTSTTTTTTTSTTSTTTKLCLTTCTPQQTCVSGTCVGIGYLSCTLLWSRPGDGDIVVTTPNNRTISYRNKLPSNNTDYGQLDVDDQVGTGPENIFWTNSGPAPPSGVYDVCFESYTFIPSVENIPLSITITITRSTSPTLVFFRTLTVTQKNNYTCNANTNTFVGSFTYP